MTHLVNDKCINCRHTTCVEVCPVDCFYEGANMLVINPDECIDCGVCIPECPEDAIFETDDRENPWYKHNEYFSKIWPNLTMQKTPMFEYSKWSGKAEGEKIPLFKKEPGGEPDPRLGETGKEPYFKK